MKAEIVSTRRTTAEWNRTLLLQELKQLEREYHHLASKQEERSLTDWEDSRFKSLTQEVDSLKRLTGADC